MQSTAVQAVPNNSRQGFLPEQQLCTGKLHFLCLIFSIITVLWISFPSRKDFVTPCRYQPFMVEMKTGRNTAAGECACRCVLITELPPTLQV